MRILQNVLYVTSPDAYLALDGENVVVRKNEQEAARVPLHNLEGIVTMGYTGASPALMGACAERGVALSFLTASGRFLARVSGTQQGSILLRKEQYRISDSEQRSNGIARGIVAAKLYNSAWILQRAVRDHAPQLDGVRLRETAQALAAAARQAAQAETLEVLRGVEGEGAQRYFSCFDAMILQQKSDFSFTVRSRRPPLDAVNALLSFAYTLLAHDCTAALECVGLDPCAGFLHRDRPGRTSLALDLMEELRAVLADRLVLSLINKRMVSASDFTQKENGAVLMGDNARRTLLRAWQERKQETLTHPFLQEKLPWGLVPYAQALLLARFLRGDTDAYPPFLWK